MLQQILNGISIGSLYALIAIGYTLIFGIIQVIFFAQGELSMLAAFAALGVLTYVGSGGGVSPWLLAGAMLFGAVAASLAGALLAERLALRPFRNAPRITSLITSLGVSIIFQNAVMISLGPQSFPFTLPVQFPQWTIASVQIGLLDLLIIGTTLVLVAVISLFLARTRYGMAIRAIAQSPVGTRLMGINGSTIIILTFVISSLTAAIAGIYMAIYYGVVKFDMGFVPGIKGFTIAILGGVGNIRGALLAGILIGVLEALFAGYISSEYKDLFVFTLLVATLLIRPHGLLGEKV